MAQDHAWTEWMAALADAVAGTGFVKLTLTKPSPTAGDLKSIDIRPIIVKRALKLSFTYHHQTRDIVKNYLPAESIALIHPLLEEQFTAARLCTLTADLHLLRAGAGWAITHHPPSQTAAPELSHDRAKKRHIETTNRPYLHALGVTDAKGHVYKTAQDKFRQINKYIEILDGLIKQLPPQELLRIVDMGAGKGYLTFALYDYLANTLHRKVQVVGVEYRAELVDQCNRIAEEATFLGLKFVQGSIADYDCHGAHVVIALHACDTATDDAIANAVRAQAELIVVAPCCHKQIRRAMATQPNPDHPLAFLMQYGTYVERIAEMVTDGMRAQLMELHGYRTNLFEFIADAHTPKNVMIVGSRSAAGTVKNAETLRVSLAATKTQFGIAHHALEHLLSAR